jgi:hypothetical protein
MPAKSHDDHGNILQWLFERGEERFGQVVQDLVGGRGLPDGLSKMIDQAAKTKGRMDKNAEVLLHLLNLPSRADYHKLLVKLEHLQGSLVNLSMKLDRLLAAQDKIKKSEKRKAESRKPEDT